MYHFRIITDSSCDLSISLVQELNLQVVPLQVCLEEKEFQNYPSGSPENSLDFGEFYDALRHGKMTSTTAANPEVWRHAIEPTLSSGQDVLVLAFSSGLSSTYAAAELAAKELREEYPERNIQVVDTLCASLGQGLLVYHAAKKQQEGLSLDETAQWVRDNRLHLCHWFTVDDLMFLKRGGRVSAATAVVGTMLNIKPVLHVDDEGHLIKVATARGRKASIEALFKSMKQTGLDLENQDIFISHGDCLDDAKYLADMIENAYHPKSIYIDYVGPVIGSHSGPGTLALFFLGSKR